MNDVSERVLEPAPALRRHTPGDITLNPSQEMTGLGTRIGAVVWVSVFLAFAGASLAVAYETAMHFNGVPLDGPFQFYNALRRIDAHYRPGIDFQFFHGLGVPYSHYWLYVLFGRGLRGAELARELLATTLYPLTFLAVFRAFTRSWLQAFALSAAAMAASYLLHLAAMLFAVNGMLTLRSTLPTLLPIVLMSVQERGRRAAAVGIALGLAMFVSTEQGLAAVLAYLATMTIAVLRAKERRKAMIEGATVVAVAVIVLLFVEVLVAGPAGAMGALRYNFRVVPMDQYWYFGAPPNLFISSWGAAVRMLTRTRFMGLALVFAFGAFLWYSIAYWRAEDDRARRRAFALGFLSIYGLVSCTSILGAFTGVYVQPCWRVLLIIGLLESSNLTSRFDARRRLGGLLGIPTLVSGGVLVVSAYALATISLVPAALGTSLPHIVRDHFFGDARFSMAGIWPETLRQGQAAVDAHRQSDGRPPTVWSTYSGWLEARNGIFHPSFDYIIQALGPANRDAYVQRFRSTRPDLVQTVRPTFTTYEGWLESNNWALYDEILDGYRVYSVTPWSILWERRANPAPPAQLVGTVAVPANATSIQLPPSLSDSTTGPTLVEVELEYETRNPLQKLPVIGASPRFLVLIQGAMSRLPISLNPWMTRERFPVVVGPGQQPTLHLRTYSLLPGASVSPRVVRLFVRRLDDGTRVWMTDVIAALQ